MTKGRLFSSVSGPYAGNVITTLAPNTSKRRFRIHSIRVSMVCDATVANRVFKTYLNDTVLGQMGVAILSSANQTAGQTADHTLAKMGGGYNNAYTANLTHIYLYDPIEVFNDGVNVMGQAVGFNGGVAGDAYTLYYVAEDLVF